jgi:hypothetical protein
MTMRYLTRLRKLVVPLTPRPALQSEGSTPRVESLRKRGVVAGLLGDLREDGDSYGAVPFSPAQVEASR